LLAILVSRLCASAACRPPSRQDQLENRIEKDQERRQISIDIDHATMRDTY
jgi:hypothetical protein